MNRGDIAILMAAREWFPFPCHVNSKQPATRSGFYAGTNDQVTIRRYWSQKDWNIGLYTGEAHLCVIDLDVKPENGPAGISTWLELCAEHDFDFEQTYCVVTPRGGLHVYFYVEDGFWYPPSTSKSSRIGPNIDVRSSGSYVCAVGSVIDGIEYEHCCSDQVLPLPDWLGVMIDRPPPDIEWMERKHILDVNADDNTRMRSFRGIADRLKQEAQAGVDRNSYFYWAVRAVGDHLWPETFKEACVNELRDIAIELGLPEREIRDTERSARKRW